ncbi:DUF2520 domain-containing protein [Rhodoferax sp. AJA081-3]|uniref:Rossmann-like and DUF2520 domain-containing protein n=1 Tax=Rhodoferax sp. AJA081-3 TaxID=2752316 RepID=UPI001ADF1041|nr:Rossmann-like and DUF2520 domain-containing protein [Rhodoferax sp. AJA081-3]QTN26969.1 DUF2520 domain-containing protein [Rhodoferax sp. AJA081-3]
MPHDNNTLPTLNLVGAGRVAQTLASLWLAQGSSFAIQDVLTTSLASAQAACRVIGAGQAVAQIQAMRDADVWMLAVPDAQLTACAQALAAVRADRKVAEGRSPIVFHCSGAQGASTLAPLAALGWQVASAHCILSFSSVPGAIQQFPGTPCALEGDATACDRLRPAFTAIGAQCFAVASGDKLLYHAAAVFATNFLPVLQATAEELWQSTGMPAHLIPALRASLLRNAVANITTLGPQAALTGPAARGDTAAIQRQQAAVAAWDGPTGAAYEALSTLALRLARHTTD